MLSYFCIRGLAYLLPIVQVVTLPVHDLHLRVQVLSIVKQPMYMADDSRIVYSVYHQGVIAWEGGTLHGTERNDYIFGRGNDDVLHGGAGDDIFYAGAGNDRLFGGAGNDTMNGDAGNDILSGGTGNDTLNGGAGDDAYVFGRGDGQDLINESSGNDSLLFGDGIGSSDLWFSRSGNHLVIDVLGSEDKVTIQNWYSHNNYKVETISAGGMELASTQMDQLIQALARFGVPQGVDGQWTDEQKEGVNAVISGYWRPSGA